MGAHTRAHAHAVLAVAVAVAVLAGAVGRAGGATAHISNTEPRRDTQGRILNAHDGSVVQLEYNGTHLWYLYGTVYENCSQGAPQCRAPCGYKPNRYRLYTSPDLEEWTLANDNVLPAVAKDNDHVDYWMPVVAHNRVTGRFVMQYWSSACGFRLPCANIATSASPYGPFEPAPPVRLAGGTPSSQMGMFVDASTNKAYIKYNVKGPSQRHCVEELADDWLSSTGRFAVVFYKPSYPWNEGGGMFKHGGRYYYQTGSDCCFCSWGGDLRYWTSYHPLGPWHPGVAPSPATTCSLTGSWTCGGPPGSCRSATLELAQGPKGDFNYTDGAGTITGGFLNATNVATDATGTKPGCDRVRFYGGEDLFWCRAGAHCSAPTPNDAPELNWCSNGQAMEPTRVAPCHGVNFTVPAQQFNVIVVGAAGDPMPQVLYYGERSMSAPDGLKSHNFQAWAPMAFNADGSMQNLTFPASFDVELPAQPTAGVAPVLQGARGRQQPCRDPFLQPFASTSIWNTPIGSAAVYSPLHLFADQGPLQIQNDDDMIVRVRETDPLTPWYNQGWWGTPPKGLPRNASHCDIVGPAPSAYVRFPADFTRNNSEAAGQRGNNCISMVQPDNKTVVQAQPFYRCGAGSPILARWGSSNGCPQDFPNTTNLYGDGRLGAHGGSGLSAMGGTVRLGEFPGGIPHAIKLELDNFVHYYGKARLRPQTESNQGRTQYVWPATGSDWDSVNCPDCQYGGSDPNLIPGALLAVPPSVRTSVLPALTTTPGRRLLDALTYYGGYVVDGSGKRDTVHFAFTPAVNDEMQRLYNTTLAKARGGVTPTHGTALYNDLTLILKNLHAVTNNAPTSIGGGGEPLVPVAPPLCPPNTAHL